MRNPSLSADGFALRYRAQRIVLDCLSQNVEKITSSETGIATIEEIEQKINQTAVTVCSQWLEGQFGNDRDKVAAQKPMPLRAVWSSGGPRDDQEMIGPSGPGRGCGCGLGFGSGGGEMIGPSGSGVGSVRASFLTSCAVSLK